MIEAEFVAAMLAGTEIIWLCTLLDELSSTVNKPSHLYIDNQSTLSVAKNPEYHGWRKHLDLQYFWLQENIMKRIIMVNYISTKDTPADLLMKALPHELVE